MFSQRGTVLPSAREVVITLVKLEILYAIRNKKYLSIRNIGVESAFCIFYSKEIYEM